MQADPAALLAELIANAPPFDAEALNWRSRLKAAGRNAGYTYRGDAPNLALALIIRTAPQGPLRLERLPPPDRGYPQRRRGARRNGGTRRALTPVGYRALRDADITELGNYLTHSYDFGACSVTASRCRDQRDGRGAYLRRVKGLDRQLPEWDGVARLDGWLTTYAGADTETHAAEYLALIGAKFVMQAFNRALHPGAKADYSLVFTSHPGRLQRHTSRDDVRALLSSRASRRRGLAQADFARGIAGAIVAHGAEMSAWRKSDVEDQKAVLTRCVDHGRPAYGHEMRSYPRRTMPLFSTNDVEFLRDATGDRRYWPVAVIRDRVNIEALRRDRDQILAEALHRLKSGEQHWPTPEEEARLIEPERQKFMPEAALEIVAILNGSSPRRR